MRRKMSVHLVVLSLLGFGWSQKTPNLSTAPTSIGWVSSKPPSSSISTVIFYEDFEGGVLPDGWTVEDGNSDGYTWVVNSSVESSEDLGGFLPPLAGQYILYYSDDDAGSESPPTDEVAISPPISLTRTEPALYLIFSWGLDQFCGDESLYVEVDGGSGFQLVWSVSSWGSGQAIVDLSGFLGASSLILKFHYNDAGGCWGWAGGFDNIAVTTEPGLSPPFYSVDFEGCTLPAEWSVTDGNSDGFTWYVETVANAGDLLGNIPPSPGSCILYYSDDDAGSGSPPTVEVASCTVTLPDGLTGLFLSFGYGNAVFGTSGIGIDVEGGNVWNFWSNGSGEAVVDISGYAGNASVTLDFWYDDGDGSWSWAGAFDNISLSETPPAPPSDVCSIFEECGPFPADYWLADMAYDETRELMYQVEVDLEGSDILIWDPEDCSYCEAFDLTTGVSQRGIAYDFTSDVIYVGGWNDGNYPKGTIFSFAVPECGQPLELLSTCDLSSSDLWAISGLAFDDYDDILYVQTNSYPDLLGFVDPYACTILYECEVTFYSGGDGYDGAGIAYSGEDYGLYAISQYDNSINFFLSPIDYDCVADTFCILDDPVSSAWGVGQEAGWGEKGEFWVSSLYDLKNYHGTYFVTEVAERRKAESPFKALAYPNPFVGSTEISFSISKESYVTLSIYDVSGRLIERLIEKRLNPGKHTVIWNARNIPQGVYFYKLVTDRRKITRKMVLLK